MAEIETKKWKNTTFESGFLKKWVAKTPLLNVGFKRSKHHKNTIFESGCKSRKVSISNYAPVPSTKYVVLLLI